MKAIALVTAHTLKDLAFRYCEATWKSWKTVKGKALADSADPFLGGPQDAMSKGITSVTKPDGSAITLTKLTRIRLRDLDHQSLVILGAALGKDLVTIKAALGKGGDGKDVVHQEWVPTFAENISNDNKHLLNNLVSVSAVLDTVFSFVAGEEMSVEDFATALETISEDPRRSRMISIAVRSSWLGRACQDGSWKESSDFIWYRALSKNVAEIDPYVAAPVLKMLAKDLREGF